MDVTETVKLRNLPNTIAFVEAAISQTYKDFLIANPEVNLNEIHVTFMGGKPTKEIVREIK